MVDLKIMIKNECEKDRTLATRIAKLAGYKNPNSLYKFLNEIDREVEDLTCVINLVHELFPDREFEIMDKYIRTLKPSKQCARQALEYCYINKQMELFEYLLKELSECKNKESQEWASVYQIEWDQACGRITPSEAIDLIESTKTTFEKTEVFKFISKMYVYYDMGKVHIMNELFKFLEEIKTKLDDDFVSISYRGRIALTMMEIKLYDNKVNEARNIGLSIIDEINNKTMDCMINLTLGNSYMFESFDLANKYLRNAYGIAVSQNNTNGIIQSRRSLNFLHNYWNKNAEYVNINSEFVPDIHEDAFYLIRQGKIDDALNILDNMDLDKLNPRQLGFHYFYRGLINKDLKTFRKSVKFFNKAGEKFYITAPIIELKKLGEDEDILEIYAL